MFGVILLTHGRKLPLFVQNIFHALLPSKNFKTGECGKMKAKLLKVLHFLGLDVLLLGLLEKLAACLTKKHEAFQDALACFVCRPISATSDGP